jgi:spectinomycin phosphotransferase
VLEKPNLPDNKIAACLHDSYGISVTGIEFLPIGNDSSAWVYRVSADDGTAYFLKVKKGVIYEAALRVPRYLRDHGIEQVVAPLPTSTRELWQTEDHFALVLYPYINGSVGMEVGLSDSQWREFGAVVKTIHATRLSSDLLEQVRKEMFRPKWSEFVKQLQIEIEDGGFDDPLERELAAFWLERSAEISKIVDRAEELGRRLQHQSLEFVLCHADIHTANVLLDAENRLCIVDWEETILAPKERDLMFVNGAREADFFFRGYGQTELDALALAYYRYEWVVQEMGDCGERVFLKQDVGVETKRDAVAGFRQLFQPGDVVEAAYESEKRLP